MPLDPSEILVLKGVYYRDVQDNWYAVSFKQKITIQVKCRAITFVTTLV